MTTLDYSSAQRIMGLSERNLTPIALIDRIKAGLNLKTMETVIEIASGAKPATPDYTALIYQIVPKATLSRRQKEGKLTQREGEVVARLAGVLSLAMDTWGEIESAREFLLRPHIMLENRRPVDLVLQSEIGAQEVAEILGRLQYGSAA